MLEKIRRIREMRAAYRRYMCGIDGNGEITAEQRKYIQTTLSRRIKRVRKWIKVTSRINMTLRNIFVKPFNYPRKAVMVEWETDFGDEVYYPHCPACKEYAYKKTHCVFCGRRFIWPDDM